MKTLGLVLLLIVLGGPGYANPISDLSSERVTKHVTGGLSNEFAWIASYDIAFSADIGFTVNIPIQLMGIGLPAATQTQWAVDFHDLWTNQYSIYGDGHPYNVTISDAFVTTNPAEIVTVFPGPGRGDMLDWFAGWPTGTGHLKPWAHETGHMLGNYDEYPSGAVNPNGTFLDVPSSIMATGLTVYDRHYLFITDWISNKEPDHTWVVGAFTTVPEPSTWLLFGSGLAGLILWRKRKARSSAFSSPYPMP